MQLTISSDDPVPHALRAVGALFGIRVSNDGPLDDAAATAQSAGTAGSEGGAEDERVTKTRHQA